jgi:hypothetical protein
MIEECNAVSFVKQVLSLPPKEATVAVNAASVDNLDAYYDFLSLWTWVKSNPCIIKAYDMPKRRPNFNDNAYERSIKSKTLSKCVGEYSELFRDYWFISNVQAEGRINKQASCQSVSKLKAEPLFNLYASIIKLHDLRFYAIDIKSLNRETIETVRFRGDRYTFSKDRVRILRSKMMIDNARHIISS